MSLQTRWISVGILIFIIAVPVIFATTSRNSQKPWPEIPEETGQQEVVVPEEPQEEISNNTISDPKQLLTDTTSVSTAWMDDKNIGVTNNSVLLFDDIDKKDYSLPEGSGNVALVTPMNDLNLLFILTENNKLYTFSPVDKKFTEQKNIPTLDYTKIKSIGTYLTYFYIMDDDMITRYARKENGFDGGTNWLKTDIDISGAETMSIDDDIYIVKQGSITKFTRGNSAPFTKDDAIKNPSFIYTTEDTEFMWILDKENKTLFKTEKSTGGKIDEYIHESFADTSAFSVNEKDNIVTVAKPTSILSFDLTSKN